MNLLDFREKVVKTGNFLKFEMALNVRVDIRIFFLFLFCRCFSLNAKSIFTSSRICSGYFTTLYLRFFSFLLEICCEKMRKKKWFYGHIRTLPIRVSGNSFSLLFFHNSKVSDTLPIKFIIL